MNCPKCNAPNEGKYTFCTECGTVIPQIYDNATDEVKTVVKRRDEMATEIMPPLPKPPPTEIYSAANTNPNEAFPTQAEVPPTAYIPAEKPIPPTQHYSVPNADKNDALPRTQVVQPITPPSNQPKSSVKIDVPQNVGFENPPTDKFEAPKANTAPKKSSKFLMVGGILLLLVLVGGGAAAYFLAQPMQSSKSYFLTNKPNVSTNSLDFDNQNKIFLMGGTDNNNAFQKWQITPDSANKSYYRFVNRGIGENMSLEVVDDNSDSSVAMAQSAKDVGQLWAITNVTGDYYRITNQWLGDTKSLSYSKQYHYFLRVRDSNSDDAQLWKKIPAPSGKGFYLVNKKYGDTILLQSLKDPDEFKDKLVMKSGEHGSRQWNLNDLGNGFHTLTTVEDGKALNINSSKTDRVIMSAAASSASQSWKMTPVGSDYFRLTNESLGDTKSLEAVTFSTLEMQMVKTSDTDESQLWKLPNIK